MFARLVQREGLFRGGSGRVGSSVYVGGRGAGRWSRDDLGGMECTCNYLTEPLVGGTPTETPINCGSQRRSSPTCVLALRPPDELCRCICLSGAGVVAWAALESEKATAGVQGDRGIGGGLVQSDVWTWKSDRPRTTGSWVAGRTRDKKRNGSSRNGESESAGSREKTSRHASQELIVVVRKCFNRFWLWSQRAFLQRHVKMCGPQIGQCPFLQSKTTNWALEVGGIRVDKGTMTLTMGSSSLSLFLLVHNGSTRYMY